MARCRQEQRVTVRTGNQKAIGAILLQPYPGALGIQFDHLSLSWHAPRRAPVHIGSIIFRIQLGLVVHRAVTSVVAILCQRFFTAVTPIVSAPTVVTLGFGLAPSEVVAVAFRSVGTHVTRRPQRTAGQTQVNPLVPILLIFGTNGFIAPRPAQQIINKACDIRDTHLTILIHITTFILHASRE